MQLHLNRTMALQSTRALADKKAVVVLQSTVLTADVSPLSTPSLPTPLACSNAGMLWSYDPVKFTVKAAAAAAAAA